MATVTCLPKAGVLAGSDNLARARAMAILTRLLNQQGSLATLFATMAADLEAQPLGFCRELCYGCCRWHPLLQQLLQQLMKKPLRKKDRDIEAILLLGLYQLEFMRTADHATVNESVKLAESCRKPWAKQLINGVLRSFQRDRERLITEARKARKSIHPLWLEQAITTSWPHQAPAVFQANNQHPPLTLRVNQAKQSRQSYLSLLEQQGMAAIAAPFSDAGIYLQQPVPVDALPGFADGLVSVQDEAAQLAANLLELEPGLRVLDACAAPGGKTCHMGEQQPALAQLVALDNNSARLDKLNENLRRSQVVAHAICGDANEPQAWWDGVAFDRILLDAPCSATGIIRRQPDIKLLRQPAHIDELVALQLELLDALWPLLAEGGILIYATCSILPQENVQVVERFIAGQPTAEHQFIDAPWGIPQTYGRQLLPQSEGHDGFYYARLVKR